MRELLEHFLDQICVVAEEGQVARAIQLTSGLNQLDGLLIADVPKDLLLFLEN